MLEGTFKKISLNDAQFEFNGVYYAPIHFFHHGMKTGFTKELLEFANNSYEKWGSSGLLLTANIDTLWKELTDQQKGMIYPKVGIMWTSLDGSTDDSIPSWMDTIAGYRPVIKQISPTKIFLLKEESLSYYFTEYVGEPILEPSTPMGTAIHIYCPHCGKKIF